MQPSTLSSRIRESAAGLTRDLLPSSTNGYGALETANELATLRSAHKVSTTASHGTLSSPQLPELLNDRTQSGRYPKHQHGLGAASDAEEELSNFLLQKCNMKDASASSSRSGSTLDLALVVGENDERWHGHHLKRNDSFEPEMTRSKQKSPAQGWYAETRQHDYHTDHMTLNSVDRDGHLGQSSYKTSNDNYQEPFAGHQAQELFERNAFDTESARRKERALSRLHLIFSQMPATQPQTAVELRQTDSFESSYNQLCGGEDAQEWAEFEASLFRAYNGQTQRAEQGILQEQQYVQESAMITGKQASFRANLDEGHRLQHTKLSSEGVPQQKQAATNDDEGKSRGEEFTFEFHCPWVVCHSVSLCSHSNMETFTDRTDSDFRCVPTIFEARTIQILFHVYIQAASLSSLPKRYGASTFQLLTTIWFLHSSQLVKLTWKLLGSDPRPRHNVYIVSM